MDVNEVRKTLEDMGLEVKIQEIEPDSTTCSVIGQNLVISQSLDEVLFLNHLMKVVKLNQEMI